MSYDSSTAIANRHDYDKTFTAEYDTNQTGATLITPDAGKVLKIVGVYVSTESTDGSIRIYFSDDENDETNTVYQYFAADENPGYIKLVIRGDKDAVLKFDSDFGADDNFFVLVNYKPE